MKCHDKGPQNTFKSNSPHIPSEQWPSSLHSEARGWWWTGCWVLRVTLWLPLSVEWWWIFFFLSSGDYCNADKTGKLRQFPQGSSNSFSPALSDSHFPLPFVLLLHTTHISKCGSKLFLWKSLGVYWFNNMSCHALSLWIFFRILHSKNSCHFIDEETCFRAVK
jgi:hypothetical protein